MSESVARGAVVEWVGADIGKPAVAGSHQAQGEGFVLKGAGVGVENGENKQEQFYLLGQDVEGDVEIVARLAALDSAGSDSAQAGLILWQAGADAKAESTMASIVVRPYVAPPPKPSDNKAPADPNAAATPPARVLKNVIELRHRDPASQYANVTRGMATPIEPPVWLKLVRIGKDYAVYRSSNGTDWSIVHNDTGGPFTVDGKFRAGVFVAGGAVDKTASATFDHIYVGPPRMKYRTSWIGNTFGADSTGTVQNGIGAMWVAPDGRVYTNSFWDEAGEAAKIYKDGKVVATFSGNNYCDQGTITGDDKFIYFYALTWGSPPRGDIVRADLDGENRKPFTFKTPTTMPSSNNSSIKGLAVGNGELYASDEASNRVLVASLETMNELPDRAFAFDRPGPIAIDGAGNLWIIRRAEMVGENDVRTKANGKIVCMSKDGKATGREITDVVNPTAITYDATKDRLLVAEGGPDQNIRIYTNLIRRPEFTASFGIEGGVWAGKTPGLISDPEAGGDARFYQPNGVGVDGNGNLYVNCTGAGTDLRQFSPDGKLNWSLRGLHFVDTGDFDPASDGRDVYTPFKHYTMDYSTTKPGGEWSFKSLIWNPFKYGPVPRNNASQVVLRRLGPDKKLVMYTSGQGYSGPCMMFRFEGETAVPCGTLQANDAKGSICELWLDKNGDAQRTDDEVTSIPRPADGWFVNFDVDEKGDIWTVWHSQYESNIRHFTFKGLDEHGGPIYSLEKGDYEDVKYPKPIGNSPGGPARVNFDSATDSLYLYGPNADKEAAKNFPWLLARFDNWSKGNREPRYVLNLPTPDTSPDFIQTRPYAYNLEFVYQAFDLEGDYLFVSELWGPIHIYDKETGQPVDVLLIGPEVSGLTAWQDSQAGVRAFKRADGEYIILEENSGFRARENMFRWKPPAR